MTKHFGEVQAVNGIDLAIAPWQIFGFLGANGSGKTATVRMLTTLLRPTAGSAQIAGLDVQRDGQEIRQGIGVALQEAGLDDYQTGRELLRLQSRLCNVPSGEVEQRINHLLTVVELEDAADRRVGTYSGEMQRRLDLVAALVHRPRIVFLDEPTTGLDPISRDNFWRYVERLNKEDGVTFFLTTQYLEEADRLADEGAILDLGRIVAQGLPTELKSTLASDVVTVEIEGEEGQAQQGLAALRVSTAWTTCARAGNRSRSTRRTAGEPSRRSCECWTRQAWRSATCGSRTQPWTTSSCARPGITWNPRRAGRGGRPGLTVLTHSYFLASRALRESIRQPGVEVGNIFIPLFFFAVIIGSVSNIAGSAFGVEDFTSFHRRWRR